MAGAERATARSVTAPRLGSIALLGLFFICSGKPLLIPAATRTNPVSITIKKYMHQEMPLMVIQYNARSLFEGRSRIDSSKD